VSEAELLRSAQGTRFELIRFRSPKGDFAAVARGFKRSAEEPAIFNLVQLSASSLRVLAWMAGVGCCLNPPTPPLHPVYGVKGRGWG
jgi:hypothetical protein